MESEVYISQLNHEKKETGSLFLIFVEDKLASALLRVKERDEQIQLMESRFLDAYNYSLQFMIKNTITNDVHRSCKDHWVSDDAFNECQTPGCSKDC